LVEYAKQQSGSVKIVQNFNTGEQYGFGAAKDNTALIKVANFVIQTSQSDGTIACRTDAPGMSSCFASLVSSRPAIPAALGIPPTPGGRSSTRLLSVMANCPRRKNASRGSVATQFGLPRPAFRYDKEFSSAVFDATFWTKSLISNGPSLSYCWYFKWLSMPNVLSGSDLVALLTTTR